VSLGARAVADPEAARIWKLLAAVADPEIPVVSILDLGIVRYVRRDADGRLHVGITPTYLACPATEAIQVAVRETLDQAGFRDAALESVLAPPWSSEWVTEAGRRKLAAFGIAPPVPHAVRCPRCGSLVTERVSEFGSTPCKAHYRCSACLEPFDAFKCI
jgi:ring-1,2-phenylacetyl-CoA epoxidase subunit PaaD